MGGEWREGRVNREGEKGGWRERGRADREG